ncbi:sigma-70 family RNA polymerase sigma factor [Aureimonas psammosilenae]|jgi:RNA polymerase sigma-70 factor (ECF subfamily)|uniref:sigma-70 family RNA polymerase sigma factor n=1 Tax=Aureimonas psammosilenae TaxID=2495496 RepID=UPI00126100F7|nr:sigma-70 family RNA polymerase sigma factor [Aureimonas psammosilenae]
MSDKKRDIDVIGLLGPLRRYALSLTRDPNEAEDLVHDALVRAMEKRDQFQTGRALRPWLMSILHNRFVDQLRSRRAEALRNAEIGLRVDPAAEGSQHGAARLADVRRAFMALPDEQRAALHLVSVEGLSYDEAAASLGIPVGTLVSRLSRARQRLREWEAGETPSNVVSFNAKGGQDASER